jgi:hypothetical protein
MIGLFYLGFAKIIPNLLLRSREKTITDVHGFARIGCCAAGEKRSRICTDWHGLAAAQRGKNDHGFTRICTDWLLRSGEKTITDLHGFARIGSFYFEVSEELCGLSDKSFEVKIFSSEVKKQSNLNIKYF